MLNFSVRNKNNQCIDLGMTGKVDLELLVLISKRQFFHYRLLLCLYTCYCWPTDPQYVSNVLLKLKGWEVHLITIYLLCDSAHTYKFNA